MLYNNGYFPLQKQLNGTSTFKQQKGIKNHTTSVQLIGWYKWSFIRTNQRQWKSSCRKIPRGNYLTPKAEAINKFLNDAMQEKIYIPIIKYNKNPIGSSNRHRLKPQLFTFAKNKRHFLKYSNWKETQAGSCKSKNFPTQHDSQNGMNSVTFINFLWMI